MNGKQAKKIRRMARISAQVPDTHYQMQTNPNQPNYRNIIVKPGTERSFNKQFKKMFQGSRHGKSTQT